MLLIGCLTLSFYLGKVWESSLEAKKAISEYPWDLSKTQFKNPISCENYSALKKTGSFSFDLLENGKIIRLVTYDTNKKTFSVTFIDENHRVAFESWSEECK